MTDRGGALAAETAEFARPPAGDDGVGFLRPAVFEDARALEHEAAVPASDPPAEPLESTKAAVPSLRYIITYST